MTNFKYDANKYVLPLLENKKWLDLACGDGELLKSAKKNKIIGEGLDIKNTKSAKYIHNLEDRLPFKNNTYEQVTCIDSIEHIGNLTQLFSEINRILKKEGIFILSVPNTKRYRKNDHISAFTYRSIKNLIKKSGFRIEKEIYFYYVPYLKKTIKVPTQKLASHFIFKTKRWN